ncbi:MAG: glycosyltransferase family 4 protein [Desulfovibrio sp.]
MRITLIISSLAAGGAERVLSTMANYWAQKGWNVTLLTLDDGSDAFFTLHDDVVWNPLRLFWKSRNIFDSLKNNWKRLVRIRRAVQASSADVVISFVDMTNIRVLLALLGTGIPVIVSERSDPARHKIGKIWWLLRVVTYPMASMIAVQSRAAAKSLNRIVWPKCVVVPNPVPIPTYTAALPALPTPFVISIGRQSDEKGHSQLIDSFASLVDKHPEWSLVLIGDGPLHESLKQQAASWNIEEKIIFTGRVDHVFDYLAKAAIFVLPSLYEGFPNALCEAMASGLPVIATACSGIPDIVTNGKDGLIIPVSDKAALTASLDNLMRDPRLRRTMGDNAKAVSKKFSVERVMKIWEAIIMSYVKHSPRKTGN